MQMRGELLINFSTKNKSWQLKLELTDLAESEDISRE